MLDVPFAAKVSADPACWSWPLPAELPRDGEERASAMRAWQRWDRNMSERGHGASDLRVAEVGVSSLYRR